MTQQPIDPIRAALVVLARFRDSDECHALQTSEFTLYLEIQAIGALAEALLRARPTDRTAR